MELGVRSGQWALHSALLGIDRGPKPLRWSLEALTSRHAEDRPWHVEFRKAAGSKSSKLKAQHNSQPSSVTSRLVPATTNQNWFLTQRARRHATSIGPHKGPAPNPPPPNPPTINTTPLLPPPSLTIKPPPPPNPSRPTTTTLPINNNKPPHNPPQHPPRPPRPLPRPYPPPPPATRPPQPRRTPRPRIHPGRSPLPLLFNTANTITNNTVKNINSPHPPPPPPRRPSVPLPRTMGDNPPRTKRCCGAGGAAHRATHGSSLRPGGGRG